MIRGLALLVAGGVAAITLMLSCSDDSPPDADAAVCDCPTMTTVQEVIPNAGGAVAVVSAVATCPANATLVGGGCEVESGGQGNALRLYSAGRRSAAPPAVFVCEWDNPTAVTATVTAWATCQVP